MQLLELKSTIERKLKNLYKLVEDEKIRIDGSLGARIQNWQDDLDKVNLKLTSLKVPIVLPRDLLAKIDLAGFRSAMVKNLTTPDSIGAKNFIHLVVEEIRIYDDEVTISGPNLGVLEAMLEQTSNTVTPVPSFMHNWRRGCLFPPNY